MSVYKPEEVESLQALLGITIDLKVMDKMTAVGINKHTQLHIAVIKLLQQVTIIKGIDRLFKEVPHSETTHQALHKLTHEIVELCEEHLSWMLEGANK